MFDFPKFGSLSEPGRFRVDEPIYKYDYESRGRHLFIGYRGERACRDTLIYLGKVYEHAGMQDLYDANVWLDISFPHVVFICGARGSGKSFDLGVFSEGLSLTKEAKITTKTAPVTTIIFDTQSQFWTLKYNPTYDLLEDKEHLKALSSWKLNPRNIPYAKLYIPAGTPRQLGKEIDFTISTNDIEIDDWCGFLGTDIYMPQGHLLKIIYDKVRIKGYKKKAKGKRKQLTACSVRAKANYSLTDLIECLDSDVEISRESNKTVVDALRWRLESLQDSQLFSIGGIKIEELLKPGQLTIIMLREVDDATKALIVGVLAKKLYRIMGEYHSKRKTSLRTRGTVVGSHLPSHVWMLIDEAHVICPSDRETAARRPLVEFVKRGRDAGLSLVLATQQPSAIDTRLLSQVDLTITHSLNFDSDIIASLGRMPSQISNSYRLGQRKLTDLKALIRLLNPGQALIADSQSSRVFAIKMRPRLSAHGGTEPQLTT